MTAAKTTIDQPPQVSGFQVSPIGSDGILSVELFQTKDTAESVTSVARRFVGEVGGVRSGFAASATLKFVKQLIKSRKTVKKIKAVLND